MKINDRSDLSGIPAPGTKGASGVEGQGRTGSGHHVEHGSGDRAELSGLAGKIAHATSVDATKRAEKVERLRLEISQGRYNPDPAEIAKGIVNDALSSAGGSGVK